MADSPAKTRRWFSFSLLTLFVMVTVLAVPLAWAGRKYRRARLRHEMAQAVLRDGGDYVQRGPGYTLTGARRGGVGMAPAIVRLPAAPWYDRLFGDDYFGEIVVPREQFDAKIEELAIQFPEANIRQAPEAPEPPDAPFPVKFEFDPARRAPVPEYLRPMLDGHQE